MPPLGGGPALSVLMNSPTPDGEARPFGREPHRPSRIVPDRLYNARIIGFLLCVIWCGQTRVTGRVRRSGCARGGFARPACATLWPEERVGEARLVREVVKRLRGKLGDNADSPSHIVTEPRVGYRMAEGEEQGQEGLVPSGETLHFVSPRLLIILQESRVLGASKGCRATSRRRRYLP